MGYTFRYHIRHIADSSVNLKDPYLNLNAPSKNQHPDGIYNIGKEKENVRGKINVAYREN